MKTNKQSKLLILLAFMVSSSALFSQCISNTNNVYAFTANGVNYEIVKENKSWTTAAACALSNGGHLAEINSQLENDSLFYHISQAGVISSNTVAPDGGGAAYLWLGGTDLVAEGTWLWNGDNTGSTVQFWQGARSGSPVGGLYNNWGNEPDNFNNQDGLGLAITSWPFGVPSQWNDVDAGNSLYYIIEYQNSTGLDEQNQNQLKIYPNPSSGIYTIDLKEINGIEIRVFDINSKLILEQTSQNQIDLSKFSRGEYFVEISRNNNLIQREKLIKI